MLIYGRGCRAARRSARLLGTAEGGSNTGDAARLKLTITLTAKQIIPRDTADYGEVRRDADVTNQNGESADRYDVLTLAAKRGTTGG